jgi:2-polyprenyl-3-methyl-5-hydroxy-6-metoxy-1,4-benzoquinol methylase
MKFTPINRSHDVISGKEDLETIYTIPDFPVFMGVTTSPVSEDIKFPMTFQISKSTGMVQINPLVPLDLVYQKSHNSGIIGKTWQEHHKKLAEFIMRFNPTDVLEIGGFTGILASHCVTKSRNLHWAIVDPHASLGTKHATVYKQFFDRNFYLKNKVQMIVHSHLLEHIIDINDFLDNCYNKLTDDGMMILSLPNFKQFIKNRLLNCLNFEHTICLDEDFIVYLFNKYNFEIVEKELFGDCNSIFFCLRKSLTKLDAKLPEDVYETNKNNMMSYFNSILSFVNEINKTEDKYYIFGGHVTSQFLLAMGLDENKIIAVLDNDPNKIKNRLYGTSLDIASPDTIKKAKNPRVIVKNGSYDEEISEQLLELNNKVKIYTF